MILEISGDGENDRMILSCQVSYTVTSSSGDYVPQMCIRDRVSEASLPGLLRRSAREGPVFFPGMFPGVMLLLSV